MLQRPQGWEKNRIELIIVQFVISGRFFYKTNPSALLKREEEKCLHVRKTSADWADYAFAVVNPFWQAVTLKLKSKSE